MKKPNPKRAAQAQRRARQARARRAPTPSTLKTGQTTPGTRPAEAPSPGTDAASRPTADPRSAAPARSGARTTLRRRSTSRPRLLRQALIAAIAAAALGAGLLSYDAGPDTAVGADYASLGALASNVTQTAQTIALDPPASVEAPTIAGLPASAISERPGDRLTAQAMRAATAARTLVGTAPWAEGELVRYATALDALAALDATADPAWRETLDEVARAWRAVTARFSERGHATPLPIGSSPAARLAGRTPSTAAPFAPQPTITMVPSGGRTGDAAPFTLDADSNLVFAPGEPIDLSTLFGNAGTEDAPAADADTGPFTVETTDGTTGGATVSEGAPASASIPAPAFGPR